MPLINHLLSRLLKSKKISKIVVATSTNRSDDRLCNYLKKKKINFFRGSLNKVATRLYFAALSNKAKSFIRISGDSPLIDYKLINKAILISKKNKYDLISNVFPRTFPKGQSVEIIKTSILGKNLKFMSKNDQEHVTSFFYKHSKKFLIKNFRCVKKKNNFKQSIDTKKDLKHLLLKLNKKKFGEFSL